MSKTIIFILLAIVALAQCVDYTRFNDASLSEEEMKELYDLYMAGAPYDVLPSPERFAFFKSQVEEITSHNQDSTKTWTRTINGFTGMTPEELTGVLIMSPQKCSAVSSFEVPLSKSFDYPASFDWRDQGKVSGVKSQGSCPSSWAFAATGAIESHVAIQSKTDPGLLSEQQLLDCSGDFNNQGCASGLPSQSYEYIANIGGIDSENTYPYMMQVENCIFNVSVVDSAVPYGAVNITAGDELAVMYALTHYGPVSVVFDGSGDFTSYKSGVYKSKNCGKSKGSVNYAGLIVGYGTDAESKLHYWIVKNSLGQRWGEHGYFRIERGVNMCGIASCASFPNLYSDSQELLVA